MIQNLDQTNLASGRDRQTQFRRHGIAGCYDPKSTSEHKSARSGNALQSSLEIHSCCGTGYETASTGSSFTLADGDAIKLVTQIAGHPYFRNAQLNEIAQAHGAAAAVSKAYEEHGQRVFEHIHGAFCCAIIDIRRQTACIGIDRLGQHSLYYHSDESALHFGGSAGSAMASSATAPTLLPQGIYNYVYFHMVPCSDSVYRGLKKLPAAHYLEFAEGECKLNNYWLPQFNESTSKNSFETLTGQLKGALRESVKNTLPNGGKVGAFLSGGLDSSTVTGILAELSEGQAQAYSIGFSAEGYDEMPFARTTAQHFGANLHEYYVTPEDVVAALPMIATSYDEPFGNSSALPAYFCAKMAAQDGVTTLLAGDGGDELFAGNERYVRQRVFDHYSKIPKTLRTGLLEPLVAALPQAMPLVSKASSYIAQANTPLPDRLQSYNFLHQHAAKEIFSDEFMGDVDTGVPLELLRATYHRPPQATDLNRLLYLDWQNTLADNDLRKVSHMCALAGVDVCYPLLDDTLLDFSCTVPTDWKMKGNDLRHFFKQSLKDWLPSATINKTKQGFGLPFGVWMQTYKPLREMAYDNLLKLKNRGFIRPEFIDKTIEMHQSEHAAYYGELVWIFTVFELWMSAHSQER